MKVYHRVLDAIGLPHEETAHASEAVNVCLSELGQLHDKACEAGVTLFFRIYEHMPSDSVFIDTVSGHELSPTIEVEFGAAP